MLLKKAFNILISWFVETALKQKDVHSSMLSYVHVLPYNAANHVWGLTFHSVINREKISNDFYTRLFTLFSKECFSIIALGFPVILEGNFLVLNNIKLSF
jgi:hypothetical protein